MSFYISSQKKSLLIKEYVLFIPAQPCRLWELTRIVSAKDLGTTKALNDLSASCTVLKSILLFMSNLFLSDGIVVLVSLI